jgi:hypothetical protein
MSHPIQPGDCVQLPDGRIARVRDYDGETYRVRVRRTTSKTQQFLRVRRASPASPRVRSPASTR